MARLLLVTLISAVTLLTAGCSSETSEGSTPPPPTATATATADAASVESPASEDVAPQISSVVADDGTTVLAIPDGALPPGTSLADVRVTARSPQDLEIPTGAIAPIASFALEPDGLILNEPALLSVQLPLDSVSGPITVVHRSGDQSELITDVALEIDREHELVTATFEVGHFSEAFYYSNSALFDTEITRPGDVTFGDSFETTITVTAPSSPLSVRASGWIEQPEEPRRPGDYPLTEYGIGDSGWTVSGNLSAHAPLAPATVDNVPPPTFVQGGTYTARVTLTCDGIGFGFYDYRSQVEFERTRTSISEDGSSYQDDPTSEFAGGYTSAGMSCVAPTIVASAAPPFTTYTLSPALPGTSNDYSWWGEDCGSVTGSSTPQLEWKHGDDESCIHTEEGHPYSVITLQVIGTIAETGTTFILRCDYYGAASGRSPSSCKLR